MDSFKTEFTGVTVFVLTTNETDVLSETVSKILDYCPDNLLHSIIIFPKDENCPGAVEARKIKETDDSGKVRIHYQQTSGIVDCFYEITGIVESSHFIVVASDLEMDPSNIRAFAIMAKENPNRIVCASKWIKKSSVEGYGRVKGAANRILNVFISVLYGKKVTDTFSVYQIYPSDLAKRINFGKKNEIVFLLTLIPLRLGIEYEEIPTRYIRRTEGAPEVSHITFIYAGLKFIFYAIGLRLTPKSRILK